jgi:radical S-adenosyl methionine domain-containing protein 2
MYDGISFRSVNWHLTTRCNYNCKFCFAQKLDAEIRDLKCAEEVLKKLKGIGIEKINFAGGEPLLHPLFFDITKMAKDMAFIVSIISNGYYLNRDIVSELSSFVDWIGLSLDSACEEVEVALGRGNGNHVKHITEIADIVHKAGVKLKINTTVTRMNYAEDMRRLLKKLMPKRWKVFQVLHIEGQNDRYFNELSITDKEFNHFKSVNQVCIREIKTVFERNRDMIDSYFMLSPSGMVMSNRDGTNSSLTPLEYVDKQNISQLLDVRKYAQRGGIYSWR